MQENWVEAGLTDKVWMVRGLLEAATGEVSMSNDSQYSAGDRIRVVNDTFFGMEGVVIDYEEAMELYATTGGERPHALRYGFVYVALELFGRRTPLNLQPSQIQRA